MTRTVSELLKSIVTPLENLLRLYAERNPEDKEHLTEMTKQVVSSVDGHGRVHQLAAVGTALLILIRRADKDAQSEDVH